MTKHNEETFYTCEVIFRAYCQSCGIILRSVSSTSVELPATMVLEMLRAANDQMRTFKCPECKKKKPIKIGTRWDVDFWREKGGEKE